MGTQWVHPQKRSRDKAWQKQQIHLLFRDHVNTDTDQASGCPLLRGSEHHSRELWINTGPLGPPCNQDGLIRCKNPYSNGQLISLVREKAPSRLDANLKENKSHVRHFHFCCQVHIHYTVLYHTSYACGNHANRGAEVFLVFFRNSHLEAQ